MRLLQVTEDLGVGGLERVVATLARRVDRTRFSPEVVCLRARGPFADQLEAEGVPVHCFDYGWEQPDYGAFRKLGRLIRERRIDVLHTHNTNALISGALGAGLAGGCRIVHTDHARAHPDRLRYYIAEHLLSYFVHRMVGVSEQTTEALRRHEWIPRRKLTTIENGIDEAPFDVPVDVARVRASIGVPADAPLIGMIARLTEQKGTTHLLRAVEAIVPRIPRLHVVIAGEGDQRAALEAQARAAGLADRVRFLGLRHDGAELMRAFDLYMLPSNWEGLPLAILEAMAARCPIIASAVGGIPAVLRDGESAVLLPPGRPDLIASAVVGLLADDERRRRFAREARRIFEDRYSATVMVRRYQALYAGAPA